MLLFLLSPALASLQAARLQSDGMVAMQVDAVAPGMAEALPMGLPAVPGKPHGVRNVDDDGEYTSPRNVELGSRGPEDARAQAPRVEQLHGDVAEEEDEMVKVVYAEVSDDGESIAVAAKREEPSELAAPDAEPEGSGVRSTPEQSATAGRGGQALVEAAGATTLGDSAADEAWVERSDAVVLGDRRRAGPMFGSEEQQAKAEALVQLDAAEQAEELRPRGERRRAYWNTGEPPPAASGFVEPLVNAAPAAETEAEASALLEDGAAGDQGRRRLSADWARPLSSPALLDAQRRRLPPGWQPPPKLPLEDDDELSLVEQATMEEDIQKNSRRRFPDGWQRPPPSVHTALDEDDEADEEALLEEDEHLDEHDDEHGEEDELEEEHDAHPEDERLGEASALEAEEEPPKAAYDGSRRRLPANFSWSQMGATVVTD